MLMVVMFIILPGGCIVLKRCRWLLLKISLSVCFREFWLNFFSVTEQHFVEPQLLVMPWDGTVAAQSRHLFLQQFGKD